MSKSLILSLGLLWIICQVSNAQLSDYKNLEINLNGKPYIIQYKIHSKHHHRKVIKQDFVNFHLETRTEKDSVLKTTFNGLPAVRELSLEDPNYAEKGFLEAMLLQLHVNDSATFVVNSEILFEAINKRRPVFIKKNSSLKYILKVVKTQSEEEVKKDQAERLFQLKKIDAPAIAQYVAKTKLAYKKTYSGIWYYIENQGDGDFAVKDDVVSIKYTGKFLDGKVFGSSDQDGRFFEFPVGGKFAIAGFDELMLLLKKGAKATFVIPCYLAYGEAGWGKIVPPNTPLVFDIEFMDIISHKLIIENKGQILEEEKAKKEKTEKKPSEEEKLKQMEKDVKKKSVHVKPNN